MADKRATQSQGADPAGGIRVDSLGLGALVTYVLVGGFLVFGFAWMIYPAVEGQNAAPCRPLRPEVRTGPAPGFHAQDLQGNQVTLKDFRGKFVVLNFWATWCEPCITEWPQVHRLAERLADGDDAVVIAMSIDGERPMIGPFLEKMALATRHEAATEPAAGDAFDIESTDSGFTWLTTKTDVVVLWDPEQNLHTEYGTKQIPDTYFIDEAGELVHAYVNVRRWGSPDAVSCIASVAGR